MLYFERIYKTEYVLKKMRLPKKTAHFFILKYPFTTLDFAGWQGEGLHWLSLMVLAIKIFYQYKE